MQLMRCRRGCNFNPSLCCLWVHAYHPSPLWHLFCIAEDLCWALTLGLTSSLTSSLHFCWPLVTLKILVIPRSTSQTGKRNTRGTRGKTTTEASRPGDACCQTRAGSGSSCPGDRSEVLTQQWRNLFFNGVGAILMHHWIFFLHIYRKVCVCTCTSEV